jgi:rhomboid protease GluP
MLNDPPPQKRHPLERPPEPTGGPAPRQQVTLVIPSNRPIATYVLLALNIAVFAIRALSPSLDASIAAFGATNQALVLVNGEVYRLLTAMFLHAGLYGPNDMLMPANSLHLVFNMVLIWTAGRGVERLFGTPRYLIIYLLGGLTGSLLSALLSNTFSVGASGAVFAIMAAEFVFLYRHRRLLGRSARAQMQSLALWAAVNFAFGALSNFGTGLRVDNWGHLGGLLGGLALAAFIAPYYLPRTAPDRPGVLVAEDINPLRDRAWLASLYLAVYLVVLIVARQIAAGSAA